MNNGSVFSLQTARYVYGVDEVNDMTPLTSMSETDMAMVALWVGREFMEMGKLIL